MLSAILVDDEPDAVQSLELMIRRYCKDISVAATAGSIKEAVNEIASRNPDIIFLDIELNPGSGFDLLEQIPHKDYSIIFITAYNEYAIDAFRYCAVDYLLKPVDPDLLVEAVQKVVINLKRGQKELVNYNELIQKFDTFNELKLNVPTEKGIIYINIDKIILFQGDRNYTQIHFCDGQKITSSKNLKEFESQLENMNFFRVNKSYIINTKHVEMLHKHDGGYVEMSNGVSVSISKNKKDAFIHFMKKISV